MFLFVPVDPSTNNLPFEGKAAEIKSHAARVGAARREKLVHEGIDPGDRKPKLRVLAAPKQPPPPSTSTSTSPSKTKWCGCHACHCQCTPPSVKTEPGKRKHLRPSKSGALKKRRARPDVSSSSLLAVVPSPFARSLAGSAELLSIAALPLTSADLEVLDLLANFHIKQVWTSELALRKNEPMFRAREQATYVREVQSTTNLRATLAQAYATRAKILTSASPTYADDQLQMCRYRALCIRDLKVKLAAPDTSPEEMTCIMDCALRLAAIEFYEGHTDAAAAHMRAFETIMLRQGGWGSLGPEWTESTCVVDSTIATYLLTRPVLDSHRWDPGALQHHAPDLHATVAAFAQAEFGEAHDAGGRTASFSTTVPPALRDLFDATADMFLAEAYKVAHAKDNTDAVERLFRWSHARKAATRSQLADLYCDLMEGWDMSECSGRAASLLGSTNSEPGLNVCLCIAAQVMHRYVFDERWLQSRMFEITRLALSRLKRHLEERGFTSAARASRPGAAYRYDLLWVFSVGATIAELSAERPRNPQSAREQERRWFCEEFVALCTGLGFTSVWEVRDVLRRHYLYFPLYQDAVLKKLLRDLERGHTAVQDDLAPE